MLKSSRRLRAAEVVEIIKLGRSARARFLSAKLLLAADQKNTGMRCAAVVSKKIAKRAVDRNRLRRALYRALASLTKQTPAAGSGIIVVFFIQSVPPDPLAQAFMTDIRTILHIN